MRSQVCSLCILVLILFTSNLFSQNQYEILCPPDLTLECDDSTDPSETGEASASNGCDVNNDITFEDSIDQGACQGSSSILRTWTCTDPCGNVATCLQTITLVDLMAPVIICTKPPPFLCAQEEPDVQWLIDNQVDVSDNCDANPLIHSIGPEELSFGCMTTRTYSFYAVDDCGNISDTCSMVVQFLMDFTPPDITCSDVPDLGCNPSSKYSAQDLIDEGFVTATDDCDIVAIGTLPVIDTAVIECDTIITYYFKASDFCNNQSEICTVSVTWRVNSPIILDCPDDLTIECSDTEIESIIDGWLDQASATDYCNDITLTNSYDPDAFEVECDVNQFQDVTFTVVDDCGSVSTCTRRISILDTTAPQITCPDDITANADKFFCEKANVEVGFPTVTDNCDEAWDVTVSRSDGLEIGDPYPVGQTILSWIATGECSEKSDTCEQVVTIVDSQPPTVVCRKIAINLNDDGGLAQLPDSVFYDGVFDNCTDEALLLPTLTVSQNIFSCADYPEVQVEVCATDEYGNTGCCYTTVKVQDNVAPEAHCKDITLELTGGYIEILPEEVDAGSTDACDITLSVSPDEFDMTGVFDVTLTVTDIAGNSSTCISQVTIIEDPTIILVQAQVWLEGPMLLDLSGMNTGLNQQGFLPLQQPYNEIPYEYLGTEEVNQMPPDVVDWILIELRDSLNKGIILGRRAALLKSTGEIVDINGASVVTFFGLDPNVTHYWLSIRHRTHIGVISSEPLQISNQLIPDDFTDGIASGANPMKMLDNGQYALWAGDMNGDGVVDAGDRALAWNLRNQTGYIPADASMDGIVDAEDRAIAWNNRNKVSGILE